MKDLSLLYSERRVWASYLFPGRDKRGSHSCPPSLPPPCSSTLAWWCSGTGRYRRSLHRLSCSSTLSSPLVKDWVGALEWQFWGYYWLSTVKQTINFGQAWTFTSGGRREIASGDINAATLRLIPAGGAAPSPASAEPAHSSEGMSSGISPLICRLSQMETLACESTHHSLSHD